MASSKANDVGCAAPELSRDQIVAKYLPYQYEREWMEYVAGLNLMQRMHGAMADMGPMGKDKTAPDKAGGYTYTSHASVSAAVKAVLEKWRIFCTTNVARSQRDPVEMFNKPFYFTEISLCVRFTNIDNPEDFAEETFVGYGVDNVDKGIGKAVTYALKYCLLKTFLISDGEELDNEAFTYDEDGARLRPSNLEQKQQAQRRPTPNRETRQQAAEAALRNAEGQAGIKPESEWSKKEFFDAIGALVESMGRSKDLVPAYIKRVDGKDNLSDVPRERLQELLSQMRRKRMAYDACMRLIAQAKDTEAAQGVLYGVISGRCLFDLAAEEMNELIPRLQQMQREAV